MVVFVYAVRIYIPFSQNKSQKKSRRNSPPTAKNQHQTKILIDARQGLVKYIPCPERGRSVEGAEGMCYTFASSGRFPVSVEGEFATPTASGRCFVGTAPGVAKVLRMLRFVYYHIYLNLYNIIENF